MITYDELRKIAALAKLSLDGEDMAALAADVGEIIEFAEAVAGADIPDAESVGTGETYPLREDVPGLSAPRDDILRNAAQSSGGYFVAGKTGRRLT
ncbi:MAG: aspartyl/glutamyl-tRNA amidotransferase subunit C [Oscillospiraceae bacterium]|jgi:aspartyl-tRNA(Asn)/glutamyl-tRNA(Gln) amidotransferase subunit C|nr:aspartyl/glutamyl-tRNA amidotransferase subunit C [Oscillospiraceae bacterium]